MAHMLHYLTVPLLIAHMSSRWYVLGTLLVLIVLYEAVKHQQTVSGSVDDCQRVGNSVTAISVPHGTTHSKLMVHTVPGSYYKVRVPAVSWWESHPFRWVVGNAPCDTHGLAEHLMLLGYLLSSQPASLRGACSRGYGHPDYMNHGDGYALQCRALSLHVLLLTLMCRA